MRSRSTKVLALFSTFLLTACFGSGKKQLEVLAYPCQSQPQQNLIVFLQGLGGTLRCPMNVNRCFQMEGFVDAVQSRNLPYDMLAPNTHLGYYQERTLVERLRADVIQPAKADGYHNVWIVGVSMGGLGALLYLKTHPEDIAGVVVLGPYLGDSEILDEIAAAGGVQHWNPGVYNPVEQWQRMLWDWLKRYPNLDSDSAPIIMGMATDDLYYKGHKLLADTLPPDRVIETGGKHRFKTFKGIWDKVLEREFIQ